MFWRTDLRSARVILTGASRGIGWALAHRLAGHGARLVLASPEQERLETLAAALRQGGGEAHVVATDVTDPAQRARLVAEGVARLGGLDILINNAGIGAMRYFQDGDEAVLRRLFEVNFFAPTELTRLALPHLRRGKDPMLVNTASVLGRRGFPGCTDYCASKFALAGWSEGLRAELARDGIHVLLVCPGVTDTSFRANLLKDRVRYGWQDQRVMPADQCARLIVRAMQRRRNELTTTLEGKAVLWANRFMPRLLDRFMSRYARTGQNVADRSSDSENLGASSSPGTQQARLPLNCSLTRGGPGGKIDRGC
jgi:short-subunit dehydrogenase